MKADTVVTLGGFGFGRNEVPEKINFGGVQKIAAHELVGGVRVLDSMGAFDDSITWSGLFTGKEALPRARQLDQMRRAGAQLTLTWSEFSFPVAIETFQAEYERFYQIPYVITCKIAQTASAASGDPGLDQVCRADMGSISSLVSGLSSGGLSSIIGSAGLSSLSSLTSTLSSAVGAVSNFATAAQSTINGVLAPLAAVQSQVSTLIASVSNVTANVTTLGGILPNNPVAQQAASLAGQIAAFTSQPQLQTLNATLGRMASNLTNASTGQVVTMGAGNLYTVAAQQFGDATAWPVLAAANGLKDPQLSGINSIIVPVAPVLTRAFGGVLNG
jgi:hypothetical protein